MILTVVILIVLFRKKQKSLTPSVRMRDNNVGHEMTNIYEDIYKHDNNDDEDSDIKKDLGDDPSINLYNEPDYEELDNFVVVDEGVIQSTSNREVQPPLPPCNKPTN